MLDRVEAEADDPAAALLSVTVLDPACGSGHFLLAAARRIATRLARARTGGVASPADYRHALRDVARACIHGVDRNPMAVELDQGRAVDRDGRARQAARLPRRQHPLRRLAARRVRPQGAGQGHSRCRLQAADRRRQGDREAFRRRATRPNAKARAASTSPAAAGGCRPPRRWPARRRALRAMPEDSPEEIAAKRKRFEAARADPRRWNLRIAADLYVAAFLAPKTGGVPANRNTVTIPTTAHVWDALAGRTRLRPARRPRAGPRRRGARLPLAAGISRRDGGRRLRRGARQSAVGAHQAAGAGVLRLARPGDRGSAERGGARAS